MTHELPPDELSAMQQVIASFTDAEAQLEQAKRHLEATQADVISKVVDLRSKVATAYAPELVAVLRHLYWQQPGIHARLLSEAAGFSYHQEMLKVMGDCPSGVTCIGCGRDIARTSRSWKPPWNKLCPDCSKDQNRDRQRGYEVEGLRARIISETRVSAPARDWLAVAALVVAYPPVALGIAQDDEYAMRDGIWLGWENGRKLQQELLRSGAAGDDVLSVPLGPARRLMGTASHVVGWDASRTVEIVGTYTAESAHMLIARLRSLVDEVEAEAKGRARRLYPDGYLPTMDERRSLWSQDPAS